MASTINPLITTELDIEKAFVIIIDFIDSLNWSSEKKQEYRKNILEIWTLYLKSNGSN